MKGLINMLGRYINRQMMHPGIIGLFINPFFFARRGLSEGIKSLGMNIVGKTLDIGCGNKPYKSFFKSDEYIGLEIDTPENRKRKSADYFYDGNVFPFEDGTFDSIVCNQVLEHVFEPNKFLSEVARVLKKDGRVLLTVPFVWDEHEQPNDYARYSSFGLKYLIEKNHFDVVCERKINADLRVLFQLANAYIYKVLFTKSRFINVFFTFLFIFPSNLIGTLLYAIFPKNGDLYLDNIILAKKNEP